MLCILKQVDMIRQVQKVVDEGIPTKITIENFQKRSGTIYTSDWTTVELDNEVVGYHADTPITIKAEAIHEANSHIH